MLHPGVVQEDSEIVYSMPACMTGGPASNAYLMPYLGKKKEKFLDTFNISSSGMHMIFF